MANYIHKPCHADGRNAKNVSQRMKEKGKRFTSELDALLNLRSGTANVPLVVLSEINDFPKMSRSTLKNKVFFGSYYIRLCKSYLVDLTRNGTCFVINEKTVSNIAIPHIKRELLIKKLKTSKIIGFEILSRHKRSLADKVKKNIYIKQFRFRYRVFIEYVSNINSEEAIKSKRNISQVL